MSFDKIIKKHQKNETIQKGQEQIMKKLAVGILAHVDAGKTTLSEAMLYTAGSIRKIGRVDKGDAFLDTFGLEKSRGITIFSKQAQLTWGDTAITLLDTPGHVDFSAEMERTLQVLDYAVLVISGADGVQGHTRTLWKLLEQYKIPVFLFINKMDQGQRQRMELMEELCQMLDGNCLDFGNEGRDDFSEQLAMCHEQALELYLETGNVGEEEIRQMIEGRRVFPCFFGSALKLEGIGNLLDALDRYCRVDRRQNRFSARVFKIMRDDQGGRLTFLKVTGGCLNVKDVVSPPDGSWEEKVDQIRIYSGLRYENVPCAEAGTICAVTGLGQTCPGEGLGAEREFRPPVLSPVLTYQIKLPDGCDAAAFLPKLRQLEEEDPMLHLVWREQTQEILAQVMGEVQIEILKSLIEDRFGVSVEFTSGSIVYKETIDNTVEGVGHFEPLRHYAEVHLILEPGAPGSGLVFDTRCSEDQLDRNWQRLVLTHLAEKEYVGVLGGFPITDMKITLTAGRAHPKHTEGGDFRQATYRAVRQGLMEANSLLLEPYYDFLLEVPEGMVGRAMTDLETMKGEFSPPEFKDGMAALKGFVPVATLGEYQRELAAYTRGCGRLFCTLKGYAPCHNQEEVVRQTGYDPLADGDNPCGSVFCAHGAGFNVSWNQVKDHMHLESSLPKVTGPEAAGSPGDGKYVANGVGAGDSEPWLGVEEIDEILNRASFANQGKE